MQFLPRDLKKVMFKYRTKAYFIKPKYKRADTVEIRRKRYVDHLQIQNNLLNHELVSGINIWLIQTYFSVLKLLPNCTYEDFISAIFTITSGGYNNVDQSLLSALLSQETAVYLMQNAELQNPETSKMFVLV